jgi:hypothetical protein
MEVGGHTHAPAALPLGLTWYPLYVRLSGPQCLSGRVREIFPPPGLDPRTAQSVASSGNYTSISDIHLSSIKSLSTL